MPPQIQTPQATNPLLRIAQGLHSVAQGGSLYGAVTGQPDDPQSKQQATLRAQYNALIGAGLTHQQAVASVLDPEAGKLILAQTFGPKTLTSLGEGYVTDKNGNVTRAYMASLDEPTPPTTIGNITYVDFRRR